jgi:hypothetical protein
VRMEISVRTLTGALLGALLLGVPALASAGTRTLSTGASLYNGSVIVLTLCTVTNIGKKAVTLSNAKILKYDPPSGLAPETDGCSAAPLLPDTVCTFTGPDFLVQGGGRIDVQGSTKSVRGHCLLLDPSGNAVQVLELR